MVVNGTGCIYRCSNEGDTEDILVGAEKLEWGDSVNPPLNPDNKARLRDAYASITRYKADNKAPQTNDSNSQDTGRADPTVNIVLYMENDPNLALILNFSADNLPRANRHIKMRCFQLQIH